jgi:hypothetical protein
MSLNSSIEVDLRALANESKKKSSDLKQLTESAISQLRSSEKPPISLILQVLASAKSTNNAKTCALALSILQKLLTSGSLDSLYPALHYLKTLLEEIPEESTQLKVLQTFMLILDPNRARVYPDLTNTIWDVFILLQASKSGLVRNTAYATLRHLTGITFDQLKDNRSEDLVASAVILLINSCEVAKSRTHELVRLKQEILSLIQDLAENSKNFIEQVPQLLKIMENDLLCLLLSMLSEDLEEPVGVKVVKISLIVCEVTKTNAEIIKSVLKILENRKSPDWQSLACLDFMSSVLGNVEIFKFIHSKEELYLKTLDTLSKVSHELFAQTEDLKSLNWKTRVRAVSEIVSHCVDSISLISQEAGIKLGEPQSSTQDSLAFDLVSTIWKPLLPILSIVVSNCANETTLQTMLNSYQTLVNLSGSLNLPMAREALLASLCQFCVPGPTGTLSQKNLQICKTLFNITHCLGSVLDSKAWHKVLDTLYKLDYLLNNLFKQDVQDLASDVGILTSAMDSLFKNTHIWPDCTISDLMSALGQLTLEFMETLSTNDKKLNSGKLFGLEKMIIVAQNNLHRVELYWDSLIAYLDCISNYKYPEIRSLGSNSIFRIMISAFKRFVENPPCVNVAKWKTWQRTLLLVLHDLHGSAYIDTQEYVYVILHSILQSSGGQLDETGWSMLLFILSKINISGPSGGKEGFKCLQLIISDFLQCESLVTSMERLISCVSKYAHSEDATQAIGAVGMYWNVSDFLGKRESDKAELWWIILEELKVLGEDPRVEVRHSALHSLHITLSTHGRLFTSAHWQRVMQDVVLGVFTRIFLNYSKIALKVDLNRSNQLIQESNEKQWEETYNIFTQNLGRIFITYLQNLQKLEQDVLDEPEVGKNWEVMILGLKQGIESGTLSIITSVLKTLRELLMCSQVSALFYSKWQKSWELFESIDERLKTKSLHIQYKIIGIVLEVLTLVYSTSFDYPFEEPALNCLFSIIASLLKSTSAESALTSGKLLPEQREIWDFSEKLLEILIKNQKNLYPFSNFLKNHLKITPDDSHSDIFCRKSLEILEKLFENHFEKCENFSHELLDSIETILFGRFNSDTFLATINIAKGFSPIWVQAGEFFLRVLPVIFRPGYFSRILSTLSAIFSPNEKIIGKLGKSNLELLCKLAEDLDMRLACALTELLYEQIVEDQDILKAFIGVIDSGCESFYKIVHTQELTLQKALNNTCFSCLLKLSSLQSKCADVASHVMVNRCREIIGKFCKEEKLSGMMPLPRIKLLEMFEVLDSIKKHEVSEGVLKKPGKKAHLLELFPQLCELITAKDPDVKESLKEIFLEVSRNL